MCQWVVVKIQVCYTITTVRGEGSQTGLVKSGRRKEAGLMEGQEAMTDKQAQEYRILTQLATLDKVQEHTKDPETLKYIHQQKEELRKALETL